MPEPYATIDDQRLYLGDCRSVMAELPERSVQSIITSPSYYTHLAWGQGAWEGGSEDCEHKLLGAKDDGGHIQPGYRIKCERCGATRDPNDIGSPIDQKEYVKNIVECFTAAKRVLKDDGTLWVVMGDSYSDGSTGVPSKNLYGTPWRVAIGMQEDGWILRSDIIWQFPTISLQSSPDRPARSHSYLFFFSKSERYLYNTSAARESNAAGDGTRGARTIWTFPGEHFKTPNFHHRHLNQRLVARCLYIGTNPGDTVLDPFCGTATVGCVALQCQRQSVCIELSSQYIESAKTRLIAVAEAVKAKAE